MGHSCIVDDPYHLADRTLDIDVGESKDGYIVRIMSDDVDDAHAILDRARAFANVRN